MLLVPLRSALTSCLTSFGVVIAKREALHDRMELVMLAHIRGQMLVQASLLLYFFPPLLAVVAFAPGSSCKVGVCSVPTSAQPLPMAVPRSIAYPSLGDSIEVPSISPHAAVQRALLNGSGGIGGATGAPAFTLALLRGTAATALPLAVRDCLP